MESDVRWQADDPEATWWDDVWPFKDDSLQPAATIEELEDEQVEASEPAEPTRTPEVYSTPEGDDSPEADPTPTYAPAPRARKPVPNPGLLIERPPWGRRLATAVVVAAAVAIVGIVAWVEFRPGPDPAARLTHSHRFRPPVHVGPDTSFVQSRIRPSGQVEVTHWIHTRGPIFSVDLRVPDVPGLAPGSIRVRQLGVASDGVLMPTTVHVQPGGSTMIPLPPTHHLFVRYQLTGVVEHSGGEHERALARVTALDVTTTRRLQTTRSVSAAEVLSLACLTSGADVAVPCGQDHGRTWRAPIGPSQQEVQVMAQVNLAPDTQR